MWQSPEGCCRTWWDGFHPRRDTEVPARRGPGVAWTYNHRTLRRSCKWRVFPRSQKKIERNVQLLIIECLIRRKRSGEMEGLFYWWHFTLLVKKKILTMVIKLIKLNRILELYTRATFPDKLLIRRNLKQSSFYLLMFFLSFICNQTNLQKKFLFFTHIWLNHEPHPLAGF